MDAFIGDNMNASIRHGNQALSLAKDISDYGCVISTSGWLLHAFYYQGQVQHAMDLAENTLAWLKQKDALTLNNIHNLYGALVFLHIEQNNLDEAWHYYEKIKASIGPFTEPREVLYTRYYLQLSLLSASGQTEKLNDAIHDLQSYESHLKQKSNQAGKDDFSILFDSELTCALLELKQKNAFPLIQWAMSNEDLADDFDELNQNSEKSGCPFRHHYELFLYAVAKSLTGLDMTEPLQSIIQNSEGHGVIARSLSAQLLQARLLFGPNNQQGNQDECLTLLANILSQAKRAGYCHLLIEDHTVKPVLNLALEHNIEADYVASLLHALQQRRDYTLPNERTLGETETVIISPHNTELLARLTPREIEVLTALSQGARNKELAESLGLSLATVKRHLQNIYGKLQVTSRTEAVLLAGQLGMTEH